MTSSLLSSLASLPADQRAAAIAALSDAEADEILHDWSLLARPEQLAPPGDWRGWLFLAGRGAGKTRSGAEWVRAQVKAGCGRIALIAPTAGDARDVMVEGDSGILSVCWRGDKDHKGAAMGRPVYEPSKRRITWGNGAQAALYSAEEPERLRGPQHDAMWADELAAWQRAQDTWDMAMFGLRLGAHPRVMVTTTPKAIPLVKALVADPSFVVTRGKTYDNAANLAPSFLDAIREKYEGTRLGRQEIDAEILGDLPGALWTLAMLDPYRLRQAPPLGRIVVAVDPAVTAEENSDEHGIIVAGLADDQRGVVLEDGSLRGSPRDWAQRAISLYRSWDADCLVVEVNQGGDMVAHTLRTIDPNVKIREVRASRGKHVRAEPVASLYEQGRIAHVGPFAQLEEQMTQMTVAGFEGAGSPDRVDALVWAMTELFPGMTKRQPDVSALRMPRARGWMG